MRLAGISSVNWVPALIKLRRCHGFWMLRVLKTNMRELCRVVHDTVLLLQMVRCFAGDGTSMVSSVLET
uniref:Uncharacterized protein n=1 Tax=Helianthus annuus TaxID=4232 RepID=A0A251UCX8_HELAN